MERKVGNGAWTREGVYYNLTNGANLSFPHKGLNCFRVIATYNGSWSGWSNQSCTTVVGVAGTITSQKSTVALPAGWGYTFSSSSINISDPDSSSHSIHSISSGSNYTVSGNRITATIGFTGVLTIPVRYKDNEGLVTNTFNFKINVIGKASNFDVEYQNSIGSHKLTWHPAGGATKYRIDEYKYTGGSASWQGESYTTTTYFSFNERNNQDGYRYSIYGCTSDTKCVSTFSSVSVQDRRLDLGGVSNLNYSTPEWGDINLTWSAASNADEYRVRQYSLKNGSFSFEDEFFTTGTSYNFTDKANGEVYKFDVTGCISGSAYPSNSCGTQVKSVVEPKRSKLIESDFSSLGSLLADWNYSSYACENISNVSSSCYRAESKGYYTKNSVEITPNGELFLKVLAKETTDPALGLLTCNASQLYPNQYPEPAISDKHYILSSGFVESKNKYTFGEFYAKVSYQRVFGTQSAVWIDSDWITPNTIGQEIDLDEYIPMADKWHRTHQFTVHTHDGRFLECPEKGFYKAASSCLARGADNKDNATGTLAFEVQKQNSFEHGHVFGVNWLDTGDDMTYLQSRDGTPSEIWITVFKLDPAGNKIQAIDEHGMPKVDSEGEPVYETENVQRAAYSHNEMTSGGPQTILDAAKIKLSVEVGKDYYGGSVTDQIRLCAVIGGELDANHELPTEHTLEDGTTSDGHLLGGMKVDWVKAYPEEINP
ncbi:fibronectin type III domain-containing protein [Flocculibacter collagenilyticus]|uniref:family 16 glycosylhydrolase n=1 Tax=Flocculibacter collagenilyticus TaxID=2744479 RepID=UPI0018F3D08C|nr:family 16 glycosylhydrolase [Flocculibacter collagenilyticus]